MSLKAQLEAIIYAAETPITLEQMTQLVKETVIAEGAADEAEMKSRVRSSLEELVGQFDSPDHGIEIRQVAGGYRSLKPPIRLSMLALETLAVIAYKQPVTVPEINDIRGVDSGGVIGTLLDRKLITTAGRKQVIGRPILYKTTKEFLMRFGLKDVNELPSMEEFEKLVAESFQAELIPAEAPTAEAAPAGESEVAETEVASESVSETEKAG